MNSSIMKQYFTGGSCLEQFDQGDFTDGVEADGDPDGAAALAGVPDHFSVPPQPPVVFSPVL